MSQTDNFNDKLASVEPAAFYDSLGDDYDWMTSDATRWGALEEDYRTILSEWSQPVVLDAGCGSGGEALLLASLGAKVVGVDLSEGLIEVAKAKAVERGSLVEFYVGDLGSAARLSGTFDLILCRGNTLPHLLSIESLRNAFLAFGMAARPGSRLILGWLNYPLILGNRERIVGVTGSADDHFVRFYDFLSEELVNFSILRIQRISEKWNNSLTTTQLRPWSADDVGMILRQTGWGELEISSDLSGADFVPTKSRDVIISARRE